VLGAVFEVSNTLGVGFLEKVYENALAHELRKTGLRVAQQHGIAVEYDGIVVGQYAVDLLVEGTIIVELKAIRASPTLRGLVAARPWGVRTRYETRGSYQADIPSKRDGIGRPLSG